jgi:hypothetical protein
MSNPFTYALAAMVPVMLLTLWRSTPIVWRNADGMEKYAMAVMLVAVTWAIIQTIFFR